MKKNEGTVAENLKSKIDRSCSVKKAEQLKIKLERERVATQLGFRSDIQ